MLGGKSADGLPTPPGFFNNRPTRRGQRTFAFRYDNLRHFSFDSAA